MNLWILNVTGRERLAHDRRIRAAKAMSWEGRHVVKNNVSINLAKIRIKMEYGRITKTQQNPFRIRLTRIVWQVSWNIRNMPRALQISFHIWHHFVGALFSEEVYHFYKRYSIDPTSTFIVHRYYTNASLLHILFEQWQ